MTTLVTLVDVFI